ncbi:MAG: branched-chain amino acid ABC transporter permease [Roseiarcus sp.]
MLERASTLVILSAIVVGIAGIGVFGSPVVERVVIDCLIKLTVVVGLSIFVGNSGIVSFGHASFAAIAAYGAAWFTLPIAIKKIFLPHLPAFVLATQVSLPTGAAIGMGAAAITALCIGFVIVRLSGISASMATFAWLSIVVTVFNNADSLTKGTSSLVGLPLATGITQATVCAIGSIGVAFLFKNSHWGLMLRASREDEIAAAGSGIAVRELRLAAFVLSAAVVGLGGVLQGHFLGVLSVSQFYLEFTFLTLAMLVLGGMRSLSGAVIGTLVVSLIAEALKVLASGLSVGSYSLGPLPGLREMGLALLMLAILLLRPRGLMGDREFTLTRRTFAAKSASRSQAVRGQAKL